MSSGANAGALAARLLLDTNGFQASMNAAGQVSERELKRIQRQVQFATDYIKELAKQQQVANSNASMAKATQQMVDYGKATELSAKQIMRANQILPAQITDIVTSLASGQKPWLVLIQQGGQIKDMYGGIGNALKALSALISPTTVAIAALTGGVIAVGAAMYQGHKAAIEFRDQTILTGNAAGLTASKFDDYAARVVAASGQTLSASKDILMALVASGKTSSGVIESQALAIARIADLSGQDAAKVADKFTEQLKEPAKFAAKLNETYNFLTIAQFKRIQKLEEEKKFVEAAALTNSILTGKLADQRKELGFIETALESSKKKWSEWWQAAMNLGKPDTVAQQIAEARKQIADITAGGTREPVAGSPSAMIVDRLRYKLAALAERYRQEAVTAETSSASAETNKRGIAKLLDKPDTSQAESAIDRLRAAVAKYRAEGEAMQVTTTKWGSAEKWHADQLEALAQAREEAIKKGKRYSDLTLMLTRFEIDAAYRQMKRGEQTQADLKDLEERANFTEELISKERALFAQRNAPFGAATKGATENFLRDSVNNTKMAEALVSGAFKRMEDAVISFARTGKLSFSSLWTFMAEEYLRNMFRMQAKSLLLDSGGSFVGFSALFSKGADFLSGLFGGAPKLAGGMEYVPYDGMPAILHKGERVQTAVAAAADRAGRNVGSVDASLTIGSVGSGVSRAEMHAAINQANAVQRAQIMRTLRQQGVAA